MRQKKYIFSEYHWTINDTVFSFELYIYEDEHITYPTRIRTLDRDKRKISVDKYKDSWTQEQILLKREYNKQYRNIPKIKKETSERRKKWYRENKERAKKYTREWRKNNPEKVKRFSHTHRAKRKEWGKPNPLNKWFSGSELHHLHIDNTCDCIYIPIELHKMRHSNKDKESMNKINIKIAEWYNDKRIIEIFGSDEL